MTGVIFRFPFDYTVEASWPRSRYPAGQHSGFCAVICCHFETTFEMGCRKRRLETRSTHCSLAKLVDRTSGVTAHKSRRNLCRHGAVHAAQVSPSVRARANCASALVRRDAAGDDLPLRRPGFVVSGGFEKDVPWCCPILTFEVSVSFLSSREKELSIFDVQRQLPFSLSLLLYPTTNTCVGVYKTCCAFIF